VLIFSGPVAQLGFCAWCGTLPAVGWSLSASCGSGLLAACIRLPRLHQTCSLVAFGCRRDGECASPCPRGRSASFDAFLFRDSPVLRPPPSLPICQLAICLLGSLPVFSANVVEGLVMKIGIIEPSRVQGSAKSFPLCCWPASGAPGYDGRVCHSNPRRCYASPTYSRGCLCLIL